MSDANEHGALNNEGESGTDQGEPAQLSREELETFRMQMKAMALVAKVSAMLKNLF